MKRCATARRDVSIPDEASAGILGTGSFEAAFLQEFFFENERSDASVGNIDETRYSLVESPTALQEGSLHSGRLWAGSPLDIRRAVS